MILGYTPFEFCCNLIFYFEFCLFLDAVLTARFRKGWMFLSYLVLIVFTLAASNVFSKMSILRILTLPVILMIFNLLMYRDSRLRCIFSAWLVLLVMFLSEYLVVALIYQPEMLEARLHEAPVRNQIICWTTEMISAGLMYWLVSICMNRVRNRFGIREMLMYTLFPASQCLLMYGWMNAVRLNGDERTQFLVLAVMIVCLIADAGLFASMFRVSRQLELETENRLLGIQIEAQRAHYSELSEQYENIRRMRHDIAKHISAVDGLLATGRSEEAAAYVTELRSSSAYDTSLGICEHPVVDAVVHVFMQNAAETGQPVDVSVSVPAGISVSDLDLVCIFGNLLDNAVEACADLPGAVIRLRAHVEAGCLLISEENPVGLEKTKKPRIPGLMRGVGIRVIEDIARKYDGEFKHYVQDGTFCAHITLRLEV